MLDNRFDPPVVTIGPAGTVTWTNNERDANHNHIVFAPGGGAPSFCLNGRAYVGNTPTIVANTGERLRWYVFNLDLGDVWPTSTRTRRAGSCRLRRVVPQTSTASARPRPS